MKGALEMVLKHCSSLYSSTSSSSPLTDKDCGHFMSVATEMGRHGLRGQPLLFLPSSLLMCHCLSGVSVCYLVLSFAVGHDLGNMMFVGLMGMWDPPREGVALSVQQLLDGGVEVKMITGDAQETAESVGEDRQTDRLTDRLTGTFVHFYVS